MEEQIQKDMLTKIRRDLLGRYFSTAKELRHLAESCGFSFVPVEVVEPGEREIQLVLRPQGLGDVLVHAARSQHWHPFYIQSVEAA
jgi:hypothetical protein